MNEINRCERAEDLVTFLYGEMKSPESADFQRHLTACGDCAADARAFRGVRKELGVWQQEMLSLAVLPQPRIEQPFEKQPVMPPHKSALAALSEFFNLAPLWLRGATALASLAFCALVVLAATDSRLAVSHKTNAENPAVASHEAENQPPDAQEKAAYEARLSAYEKQIAELEAANRKAESATSNNASSENVKVVYKEVPVYVNRDRTRAGGGNKAAAPVNVAQRNSNVAPRRNAEVAAREDELPRLSDLLGSSR